MKVKSRWVYFAPVCLALGILACSFGAAASPDSAPPADQDDASAPPESQGGARQALIDAFTKLESAYPYRLTETATIASCGEQIRITEFASPDEFHTTWSGCSMNSEVISTGGRYYYYVNGSWVATDLDTTGGTQEEVDITELVRTALTSVELTGTETVTGGEAYSYAFHLQDEEMDVTGTAWIGSADGLPHQVQADFTISGLTVSSMLIYEYGVPVDIQVPIQ